MPGLCGGRDMSGGVVLVLERGLSVCGPRVVWWSQMGLYIPPHLPPSLQPVLLRSSCWMYLLFRSDFFSRQTKGNVGHRGNIKLQRGGRFLKLLLNICHLLLKFLLLKFIKNIEKLQHGKGRLWWGESIS